LQKLSKATKPVSSGWLPTTRGLYGAIANKVYVVGGDKDDLLQEGMLGLFFAITNYDETKGAFPSYAKLCVKGRIADAVRKYVNDKNKPLADYIDIASIEQMTDESTPLTDLIVKEQSGKDRIGNA